MNLLKRGAAIAGSPAEDLLPAPPLPQLVTTSFMAARSYADHRVRSAERQAKQWKIAGAAGMFMGVCGLGAVAALLPLKRDVDHFWVADKTTGVIEQLPSFDKAVADAPRAFDVWFVERYVRARETWLPSIAARDHNIVEWSSNGVVRADYEAKSNTKNPDSPDRRLGDKGSITVEPYGHDLTCSSATRCNIRVYFRRTEQHDGDTQLSKPETWFADVDYELRPDLIPPDGRAFNPTGLIVTYYNAQEYSAR